MQHDQIQAVVQVAAEFLLLRQVFQVQLGRRDDAHVDGRGHVGAEPFDIAFLQHAQQFHLQRQRQAFDFVEEESAVVRVLDLAHLPLGRARECARFVAEDFAFKYAFGNRAAVDGDKVVLAPMAEVVQAAGHHFLARARVAIDQYVGRFVGYVEYQAPYVAHRHGISQQA